MSSSMNSPATDSISGSSSPPLLSASTEIFNRLQAFQVYLEMSGTIDALTDCIAQLNLPDGSTSSSILEQFKSILRAKLPQTVEAECLQEEIEQLTAQIAQLHRKEN